MPTETFTKFLPDPYEGVMGGNQARFVKVDDVIGRDRVLR